MSAGHAEFRFYGDLADLLDEDRASGRFRHSFDVALPVGRLVEAFGVPLDAVEMILVNGVAVTAERVVDDGDRVAVYPRFYSFDVSTMTRP